MVHAVVFSTDRFSLILGERKRRVRNRLTFLRFFPDGTLVKAEIIGDPYRHRLRKEHRTPAGGSLGDQTEQMSDSLLFCIHRNRLVRQLLVQTLTTDESRNELTTFGAVDVEPGEAEQQLTFTENKTQIALIDLALPELAALRLTQHCIDQGVRVVLLASAIEPDSEAFSTLVRCIAEGAHGYVLEDTSVSELVRAIKTVAEGEHYCSSAIFAQLMGHLVKLSRDSVRPAITMPRMLTERELQILHWIAEGYSNKQVARKLSLSIYTVKNHVHRILNKLNASDRTHAVRHAMEANWLPLSESLAQARYE